MLTSLKQVTELGNSVLRVVRLSARSSRPRSDSCEGLNSATSHAPQFNYNQCFWRLPIGPLSQ